MKPVPSAHVPITDLALNIYLPYSQFVPAEIDLMLRLDHLDARTTAALREAVHEADPGASIRAFGIRLARGAEAPDLLRTLDGFVFGVSTTDVPT